MLCTMSILWFSFGEKTVCYTYSYIIYKLFLFSSKRFFLNISSSPTLKLFLAVSHMMMKTVYEGGNVSFSLMSLEQQKEANL